MYVPLPPPGSFSKWIFSSIIWKTLLKSDPYVAEFPEIFEIVLNSTCSLLVAFKLTILDCETSSKITMYFLFSIKFKFDGVHEVEKELFNILLNGSGP